MFAGVVFHYLYRGLIPADRAYFGIGTLFATFCAWWWAGPQSASLPVAWNYAFALLTFAAAFSWPERLDGNRLFDFFANISYPLYVIHGVGGYVLLRILLDRGTGALLALVVTTAGCIALSWFLHLLVERPSQRLGRRFGRQVNDSLAPAVASG